MPWVDVYTCTLLSLFTYTVWRTNNYWYWRWHSQSTNINWRTWNIDFLHMIKSIHFDFICALSILHRLISLQANGSDAFLESSQSSSMQLLSKCWINFGSAAVCSLFSKRWAFKTSDSNYGLPVMLDFSNNLLLTAGFFSTTPWKSVWA